MTYILRTLTYVLPAVMFAVVSLNVQDVGAAGPHSFAIRVVDIDTNKAIVKSNVKIYASAVNVPELTGSTSNTGALRFQLTKETYTIVGRRQGYQTVIQAFKMPDKDDSMILYIKRT